MELDKSKSAIVDVSGCHHAGFLIKQGFAWEQESPRRRSEHSHFHPSAPMSAVVTIRALARHLGFSKSTVAAALNGTPGIAATTVTAVRAAAEQLGYRPNPLVTANMMRMRGARAARTHGTTLGYLSDLGRQALFELGRQTVQRPGVHRQMGYLGAKERADALGFGLDLIEYGRCDLTPVRLREVIRSRGIRGFVIAPHTRPQIELDLRWDEFATVCIGFSVATPRFDRVGYDHHEAIMEVCRRIWQQGRRRVGLVLSADFDRRVMHVTRAGFLRCQADYDSKPLPIAIVEGEDTAGLRNWLRRHRPDCVIAQGADVLTALAELGVQAADGTAVVTPTLTPGHEHLGGYEMSLRTLAGCAVDLLAAKLYRNEYGIPGIRHTTLVLGPWVEPAAGKA